MAIAMAVKRCVKYNWGSVDLFALLSFILLLITKAESSPRPCQPNLRGCAELKAQKQFTIKDPHTAPLQYLSGNLHIDNKKSDNQSCLSIQPCSIFFSHQFKQFEPTRLDEEEHCEDFSEEIIWQSGISNLGSI